MIGRENQIYNGIIKQLLPDNDKYYINYSEEHDTYIVRKKKNNKVENLFNDLREDEESVFYAADQISKNLINKARKSYYLKDKVFVNIINENKEFK